GEGAQALRGRAGAVHALPFRGLGARDAARGRGPRLRCGPARAGPLFKRLKKGDRRKECTLIIRGVGQLQEVRKHFSTSRSRCRRSTKWWAWAGNWGTTRRSCCAWARAYPYARTTPTASGHQTGRGICLGGTTRWNAATGSKTTSTWWFG